MTSETRVTGILVPIDIYGISRTTLEILVTIAERLHAGLHGLIIEDSRLERVATLPFAREIALSTGSERELYRDSLARLQESLLRDIRRRFDELAGARKIPLHFQKSTAGRSLQALLREGADVFLPARQRQPMAYGGAPGGRAPRSRRLGLFYDRSHQAERAVEIALALVAKELVAEVGLVAAGRVPMALVGVFADLGVRTCVQHFAGDSEKVLADLFRRSAYGLILVPRNLMLSLSAATLDSVIEATASEVLVLS